MTASSFLRHFLYSLTFFYRCLPCFLEMERQTQTAFSLFMLTLCKRISALKPTWARWLTLAEKGELILVLKLQS